MKKIPFHFQIFFGMIAGLLIGFFLPSVTPYLSWIGQTFIKILKLIVMPLIFLSILDGITRVADMKKLSELGWKTCVFYLVTNMLAVLTSLVLVNWIQPGNGMEIFGHASAAPVSAASLFNIIPDNALEALVQGNALQMIFLALCLGIGAVMVKDKIPVLIQGIQELNFLLMNFTQAVIRLAPFGVMGLMAAMVHALDWSIFWGVGKFALTIMIGLILHGMITLPLFFKMFSSRPLIPFLQSMQPALLSAFSTSSSSATLPITMSCMEKEKMPHEISGFVLPLGATVNMDGTAIYEAAACLFVAQAIGIHLTLGQQLIVFVMSALAAIGAASIPSAGLITLTLVLSSVGLPLDGIGFLLAIDRPLDMSRTIVNVWGDMVGCAVVEGKSKQN